MSQVLSVISPLFAMATVRGYSWFVEDQVSPRFVARFRPNNVRGFSLSSNRCRQGSSPRNVAPHRENPACGWFYGNPPCPTSNTFSLCATPRNQPTGRDPHSSV